MNFSYHPNKIKRFKKLPKVFLVILFTSGYVFVPVQTAQANIFDPLLRMLLPFYDGNESIKIDNNHDAAGLERSAETSNKLLIEKQGNTESLSDSAIENIEGYDDKINQSKIFDHNSSTDIIDQKALPILTEPSLYELLDAEFSYDRGDIDKALSIYKRQAFGKNATAIFERALTLSLAHEDIKESLEFAASWQEQNPDHVPAWFYVAHLALRAHEYDLAGNTLEKILEYDPKADFSQILQGIYPETEGDKIALLTTLENLYSEENANLSILKAGLLLEFNDYEQALLNTNHALAIEPNNTPFITLKADIFRKLHNKEALFKLLADARKRLPNEKALYIYEARYRLDNPISDTSSSEEQNDNAEKAWKLLKTTTERFPDDPEIRLLASLVSIDTQHYETGDKLLTSLLDRPAYIDQAYYYLGLSAERQNRYQSAKNYFTNVMQENLALEARKKVVAYYLIQEDTESAINTLITLRRDFPIYAPESYILQADILKQLSRSDEAQQLLAQANQDYPNRNSLRFAYAKLMDNNEKYTQKRKILEKLREQEPNNLSYQLEFAKLLLTKNPSSKKGSQLATEVINTPFTDPRFERNLYLSGLNTLAQAQLELKNYAQVVQYLQAPYEVLPTEATGKLLLKAYQGLEDSANENKLRVDLQQKFNYTDP